MTTITAIFLIALAVFVLVNHICVKAARKGR